jgi:hypothetical protein
MHSRDARAEFVARAPYRRERGLLFQRTLIVRVALRATPTFLCTRPDLSEQQVGLREVRPLSQKVRMVGMARWSAGLPLPHYGRQGPACGLATPTSTVYFKNK